jgi:CheY-like chemotaxis protein
MDIRMPVMDGIAATKEIRQLDREDSGSVVILAMSANSYPEDIEKSKQSGMNDHAAKPVIPQLLYETIEKTLSNS